VLEDAKRSTHFVQISAQKKDHEAKIRATDKRLREVGRDVRAITYWSCQKLDVDLLEDRMSDELGLTVRVRDWHAFVQLANHNPRTVQLVQSHFKRELFELTNALPAEEGQVFEVVSDPSVYVFLQFEKAERFGKGGLVAPILDALIYWSLRDTDPDANRLLTREEIKTRIAELLPSASRTLLPSVDDRLKRLSTKDGGGVQRIRFYADADSFCLPYNIRFELAAASAAEITLKAEVRKSLVNRAKQHGATQPEAVAEVCERAIYRHFNEQGLILAAFLEKRLDGVQISDQIVECELQSVAADGINLSKPSYVAALGVLQGVFYSPNPKEDEFLHRLSKTSLLLFSLKHCPRLIEYFNKMTGKFRLLVGTDVLVKALSESFLPPEHRHVTNLLKVAKACGATLLLAKPVAHELYTHIHAAHQEFVNYYAKQEPYITPKMAAQSNRIMIRTYFYARLLMNQVSGWKPFIEMFVDYEEMARRSERGQHQLEAYLCKVFGLEPMSLDVEGARPDPGEWDALSEALRQRNTKRQELARNDALMVLTVYAQRRSGREVEAYDGFGLRTWWLTKESHVLAYTGEIVRRNGGTPYIMRPEFLLNFLTLSPSASEVDPVVRDLLPSHVGLQIGQHLRQDHMHKFLTHIDRWKALPAARREVIVTEAVDQLKYDRLKRYQSNLDLAGTDEGDALVAALNAAS
jgi:hypothetical protein